MPKRPRPDPKAQALAGHGALNPHPERIVDPRFADNDFFDPRDLVQVRYEMLRRVRVDGVSLSQAARAFGVSRPSFYKAQSALDREGLPGLIPRRRGPRRAHKLTAEAMEFIEQALGEDSSLRARALARLLQERLGLAVHPRSIERALARRQKKRL